MPEVRTTGPAKSWRLVHDGTKVLHLFESGGYTSTIWSLEEFPTKEAAETRIVQLKLVPLAVESETAEGESK